MYAGLFVFFNEIVNFFNGVWHFFGIGLRTVGGRRTRVMGVCRIGEISEFRVGAIRRSCFRVNIVEVKQLA